MGILGFRNRRSFAFRAVAAAVALVVLFAAGGAEAARKKKKTRRVQKQSARVQAQQQANRFAAIVIDASDGRILSETAADRKLYPASLTKMMTLYLAFESLNAGTLRKSQRIQVSRHAAAAEPSSLGLAAGSTIQVEDAILALVTKSANDVAAVLGEAMGEGSELQFAQRMNAKARELGMTGTRFVNASGLYDPAQVSTARDIATLSRALVMHYPSEYRYFSTQSFTWAGRKIPSHNHLMKTYRGMDGIKTGYVRQSGFNLAASAVRDGRRLIGVVFGGKTAVSRDKQMAKLLDAAFTKAAAKPGFVPAKPEFSAMGLVVPEPAEAEGDAAADVAPMGGDFRPKPISTRTLGAYVPREAEAESWTIQVGSFGTREASDRALKDAHGRLSRLGQARGAKATLVPLATNRGTIWRARLAGMSRAQAEDACRVLKENCLILAAD